MTSMPPHGDPVTKELLAGHELKDRARKTRKELELYKQAAERFRSAGELSKRFAASEASDEEAKSQAEVFAAYYHYEEHDCLQSYYYEHHDVANARIHHAEATRYLAQAIALADNAIPAVSAECARHLSKNKRVWQHYEKVNQLEALSIDSREAWDTKNHIRALDVHRRMLRSCQEVIADASDPALDPVYERIATGNLLGTLVNASQAFAQICLTRAVENETMPPDLGVHYVRELYSAYEYGQRAFRVNPEWDHYREDSNYILGIIKEFLGLNRQRWGELYDVFRDQPGFLAIMRDVDVDTFKKVEEEKLLRTSKTARLWQAGGFWLLALAVVSGIVIILATHAINWWQLLLGLVGIEVLLVLVGAFTLRSIGELSDKNFMSLITLAFQQQFKMVSSIKDVFKSNAKNTSESDGEKPQP
jgi:hypothetical protein